MAGGAPDDAALFATAFCDGGNTCDARKAGSSRARSSSPASPSSVAATIMPMPSMVWMIVASHCSSAAPSCFLVSLNWRLSSRARLPNSFRCALAAACRRLSVRPTRGPPASKSWQWQKPKTASRIVLLRRAAWRHDGLFTVVAEAVSQYSIVTCSPSIRAIPAALLGTSIR